MADEKLEWMPTSLATLMGDVECAKIDNDIMVMSSSTPAINIAFPATATPSPDDVSFILTILEKQAAYIRAAEAFLCGKLRDDPSFFGVQPQDVDTVIAASPVDDPAFIFRLGQSWEIHFQEGKFKIAEEFGVIVSFEGEQPTQIDDLSNAEGWYDPDTNEFVPY
jgi:hypothetical protein